MTAQVRLQGASRNGRTRRDARPIGPVEPMHPHSRIPYKLLGLIGLAAVVIVKGLGL